MEQSLLCWLQNANQSISLTLNSIKDDINDDDNNNAIILESNDEIINAIILVGSNIFTNIDSSNITLNDIYNSMSLHFDRNMNNIFANNSIYVTIESLIICAVSDTSENRSLFVQWIMNMESEVRRTI
jgi:hypothetical protein